MKTAILSRFAIKNIRTNRSMLAPFILSSSIMLSIFYIMRSLVTNDYVVNRHKELPTVMNFGTLIVLIFTFVFVIYANRYLIKRRSKEFALYSILGLEIKHIRFMLFMEELLTFIVVVILSSLIGHVFGKLSFLGLNRIMKDLNVELLNYSFSLQAFVSLLVFIGIIFIAVFIISCRHISATSPMQLLSRQRAGQKEPKSRLIISLLGVLILVAGYYIALTSDGTLASIKNFFVAVVMVIIATYLLFMSFSISLLKVLKKRESYYKTKNFLSISGMLYRMKANAVGLASISLMSTALIITVGSTMSIYSSIESVADGKMDRDYSLSYGVGVPPSDVGELVKVEDKIDGLIRSSVKNKSSIKDMYIKKTMLLPMLKKGDRLLPLLRGRYNSGGSPVYGRVELLDSYNKSRSKNISLRDDEVIIASNNSSLIGKEAFEIGGKKYRVKGSFKIANSELPVDFYYIVFKDYSTMANLSKYYKQYNISTQKYTDSDMELRGQWNIRAKGDKDFNQAYMKKLKKISSENNMEFLSKDEVRRMGYSFNGGFLFIGLLIGIMFLVGTVLVTYYKQLTEAYEDRDSYQIMKRIGLPEEMIKKTAASQIVWMLFISLFVAVVHTIVASKVLRGLLGLLGVWSYEPLFKNLLTVMAVFVIFYLLVFKLTSYIYYKIVN